MSLEDINISIQPTQVDNLKITINGTDVQYTGDVSESDQPNGFGTAIYPDGSVYTGEWKAGQFDGKGTWMSSNGEKYTGDWKEDKFDGKGTLKWPTGEKYTGQFKEGKSDGKGTLTSRNEDVVAECEYEKDFVKKVLSVSFKVANPNKRDIFTTRKEGKIEYKSHTGETFILTDNNTRFKELLESFGTGYTVNPIIIANSPADLEKYIQDNKNKIYHGIIEIPRHAFFIVSDGKNTHIYDNGGLTIDIVKPYMDVITNNKIQYHKVLHPTEVKFEVEKEGQKTIQTMPIPKSFACRHNASANNTNFERRLYGDEFKNPIKPEKTSEDYAAAMKEFDEGLKNPSPNVYRVRANSVILDKLPNPATGEERRSQLEVNKLLTLQSHPNNNNMTAVGAVLV